MQSGLERGERLEQGEPEERRRQSGIEPEFFSLLPGRVGMSRKDRLDQPFRVKFPGAQSVFQRPSGPIGVLSFQEVTTPLPALAERPRIDGNLLATEQRNAGV